MRQPLMLRRPFQAILTVQNGTRVSLQSRQGPTQAMIRDRWGLCRLP
eukprot:COSAG03_NODE_13909_length_484_cov_0.929870_1_plen_46_part_01